MNINQVVIAGRLGRDPEIRFIANEKAVCKMSLALSRRWKSADGEKKEKTSWVEVEVWGRTAELCAQHLVKGRECAVIGRLDEDTWDDKDTGKKRSRLKVVGDEVQFVFDGKGKDESDATQRAGPSIPTGAPLDDDSNPPF